MPNLDYIYKEIVAGGALESLILAPKKDCSLQDRVGRVLKHFFALHEDHFPEDLKKEWRTVKSVYDHEINPQHRWRRDPVDGKVQSLTRKEAERVLQAFLTITVEVIKRLGPTSLWKRRKYVSG